MEMEKVRSKLYAMEILRSVQLLNAIATNQGAAGEGHCHGKCCTRSLYFSKLGKNIGCCPPHIAVETSTTASSQKRTTYTFQDNYHTTNAFIKVSQFWYNARYNLAY